MQELAQNTLPLRTEGCHPTSEPEAPAGSATAVLNIALAAAASSQPLAEKSQIQPFLCLHWMLGGGGQMLEERVTRFLQGNSERGCFLQETLHLLTSHMGLCRRKGKSQEPGKFPQGHSQPAQTPSGFT